MTQEALKLALEALESVTVECNNFHHPKKDQNHHWAKCPPVARWDKAITAIKEALAQKQEPVAYLSNKRQRLNIELKPQTFVEIPTATDWEMPLYMKPPQRTWVGLTDEDICMFSMWLDDKSDVAVFTAIEARLKELNT